MQKHNVNSNPSSNSGLFYCTYCSRGFPTQEDNSKHLQHCNAFLKSNPKKGDNLHFRNIKLMKNENSNEDYIIQPGPNLPEGQYTRRRAYRAEHKNSWALALEKFKYVKCIYQNCYFIAMSLEDMIAHFGYCNGDGSFAKFVCPYCKGRVTSETILLKHIERSHSSDNNSVNVEFLMNENGDFCFNSNSKTPEGDKISLEVYEDQSQSGEGSRQNPCSRPVFRQYQSKRLKMSSVEVDSLSENNSSAITERNDEDSSNISNALNISDTKKRKSRGRPKKPEENREMKPGDIKCGKCNFTGPEGSFTFHNMKTHYGLGWIEGENPVDLNDEKLVMQLVKEAFKLTKKATCENCDVVKRSVFGFVSHIQICGKSDEEKAAMKVMCPHCDGKYPKYTLAAHIKFVHTTPEEREQMSKTDVVEEILEASGKRRSAMKAVSKVQKALNDSDEGECSLDSSANYTVYERGNDRTPKLNSKLHNLWYKLKRENKKIPCRHANCPTLSEDVKEAKKHHYNCLYLPEKVFMCESCDYYSVEELAVQAHVTSHRKYSKQRKAMEEEEVKLEEEIDEKPDEDEDDMTDVDEEEEEEEREKEKEKEKQKEKEKEIEKEREKEKEKEREREKEKEKSDEKAMSFEEVNESIDPKKRKKKKNDDGAKKKIKLSIEPPKLDGDIELRLKQAFCRREKIDNVRGVQFYINGLEMVLEEELSMLENVESWPELHTTIDDWSHVHPQQAVHHFPELTKSVNVCFSNNDIKWRRFDRFDSDLVEDVPVFFAGGSIRSISWCKISYKRMMEKTQKQYLAVTTAKKLDHLRDVNDRSTLEKSSLLQIWDCGALDNDIGKNSPKFSLGIIQKGGEIWDLKWFPADTYSEGMRNSLRRLGLLATASEDGAVRVWSICDPDQLPNSKGFPVYTTDPVAMLVADQDMEESCLHLSIASDGILAGGYGNGAVAVWNLKSISLPFCKTIGKCKVIRAHMVLHAHKSSITALTFCPLSSRYISTAGLDRYVKVWDLEFPTVPTEQYYKEYSFDNIWTINWPCVIYNFDDVVINYSKGAVKFIKDIVNERHQSTFTMEDTCLSLSFNDWLNALCGGSITGEVKLRLLKSLIIDQKRSQSTISSIQLKKLSNEEGKEQSPSSKGDKVRTFPRNYEEASLMFGLVFKDDLGMDKGKPKKPEAHPEEFPIRAVNKIAFNPNFKSFTHIAVGYNCGLIRIQPLKELQSSRSLKYFLDKAEKGKF